MKEKRLQHMQITKQLTGQLNAESSNYSAEEHV